MAYPFPIRRLVLAAFAALALPVSAQDSNLDPTEPEQPAVGFTDEALPVEFVTDDGLTGNWGGVRSNLGNRGVVPFANYTAEIWGNTTGGIKTGVVYTGLLDFGIDIDFDPLIGWEGASFNSTWLWISGQDASGELTGNIFAISNIAGYNTVRSFELWFQQNLFDDRISLRVGQLSADSEFVISQVGGLFINGTFGWPAFMSESLPEGGPAYPLGVPGIRLAVAPAEWLHLQSGVYQGNPFSQEENNHGFEWDLSGREGWFWISEVALNYDLPFTEAGLPGTFKFGTWYHTGNFESLLVPDTIRYDGNYGVYAIFDQALWQEPVFTDPKSDGTPEFNQGLAGFLRVATEPQSRNFFDFYIDGGLVYTGLIPGRDDDQVGVAVAYGSVSQQARGAMIADGSTDPGYELALEATYAAEITPWFRVQPNVQWILHPGGTTDLGDALVLGMRASLAF